MLILTCFQAAYTDVRVAQTASDSSHGLKVNPKHVAFASGTGVGGGVISVLPWGAPGKYDKETAVLSGHAGGITDLDFSPFDDDVLASGSDDATVKVWRIPAGGLTETISSPLASLSCSKRVEAVKFNPSADGVLATAAGAEVRVWNVSQGGEPTSQLVDGHTDLVHSISWKSDGTLLASSSKDKKLRVLDPRANTVVAVGDGHTGIKASLVQWLGNKDRFISTGFSKMRDREFALWDMRNLASPLARESLDTSTGILLPLYDEDANLIFFTGKGDASVRWFELLDDKGKYFSWPGTPAVIDTPHKGVTLVPKRALDVMSGEVDCMLRSTQAGLVPLSFIVPRKSYTVFLDDVFPDTRSTVAGNSAAQWFAGEDGEVPLMSLDPDRRGSAPVAVQQPVEAASSQADAGAAAAAVPEPTPVAAPVAAPAVAMPTPTVVIEPAAPSPAPSESSLPSRTATPSSAAVSGVPSRTATPSSTTSSYKSIVRVSSYRYMSGKVMHPSNNYDHLKDLAIKMGGESNVLHASERFLAVPLSKPGGQVGIIPVEQTGRQPTKLHAVVNGAELLDLAFDPFDPYVLATATDDGSIRIWRIPEGGLTEDVATPVRRMIGHQHRVNLIRYHPLAKDIIISASPELSEPTVRLWNTATGEEVGKLAGFQDLVFDVSVSYDGALIAVVSKDKKIRVFDARSGELLQTGPSHEGVRGCRVVWLGKTGRIATIGADRSSNREIRVYDADNLAAGALSTTQMDISPGVLVPYYDEDTKVLFLWGRVRANKWFCVGFVWM